MKILFKNIVFYSIIFIGMGLVTSCSDDDSSTEPYDINYVYTYSPIQTEHVLAYLKDGTFTKTIDEEKMLVPVRCTKPAPMDLIVTCAIDESLVESYNKTHDTHCVLLKNAKLENTVLTIKKGEYVSAEALKVLYTDMTEFQNGKKEYILPISIMEVKGDGVSVSANNGRFFLTYESSQVLIGLEQSSFDQPIFPNAGWAVSKDGFYDAGLTSDLTDFMPFTSTLCDLEKETVFEINMGKKELVSGLVLSFEAPFLSAKYAFVSVSLDGDNYMELGGINLPKVAQHILTIYDPGEVQYIKISVSGHWGEETPSLGDIYVLTPP